MLKLMAAASYFIIGLAPLAAIVAVVCAIAARRKRFASSKYAAATGNGYFATMGDAGARGEYALALQLEQFDPGGLFLFNVYVPRPDGTTSEVDAVDVNATGVYVFECKNYTGWIFGRGGDRQWTATYKGGQHYQFANPARQNAGHVRALREYLGLDDGAFVSVVVFGDGATFRKVEGVTVPITHTSRVAQMLGGIREARPLLLDAATMQEVYAKLEPCAHPPEEVKASHRARVANDGYWQ